MGKVAASDLLSKEPDLNSKLSGRALRTFERVSHAIQELARAPQGRKCKTARALARRLGIKAHTLFNLRSRLRLIGPVALVDRRKAGVLHVPRKNVLPDEFSAYVRALSTDAGMTRPAATRFIHKQLTRWRNGDDLAAIPGYSAPPQGNPPPGFSSRNLARYLPARPLVTVTLKLSEDGKTRIVSGNLEKIPRHPLFSAVHDSVQQTKRGQS